MKTRTAILGLLLCFFIWYGVTATAETFYCVNKRIHTQYPRTDRAEIWTACLTDHFGNPVSFFP